MSRSLERTAPGSSSLVLGPRSGRSRRIWKVGAVPPAGDEKSLVLHLPPSTESFHSFIEAFVPLRGWLPGHRADLGRLDGYLRSSRAGTGEAAQDGPTIALRRRISRESGPSTRAIELGAMLLMTALETVPSLTTVHVADVDLADGLSLRVLARAAILMSADSDVGFVWYSRSHPMAAATGRAETARANVLQRAAELARFRLELGDVRVVPSARADRGGPWSLGRAATDLVAHNYEATLLGCEHLEAGDPDTAARALRLRALAQINLGELDEARSALDEASARTADRCFRAHLACLLALLAAKRNNDIAASDRHLEAAMRLLDGVAPGARGDPSVERAWLLNGLALNRALEYRAGGSSDRSLLDRAAKLEKDAFQLVAKGNDPERVYLRYNLLANTAFLAEMVNEPEKAITIFTEVFRRRSEDPGALATLAYRIGVLHAKAGRLAEAVDCLASVPDLPPEEWASREHLLRARGFVALAMNDPRRAESCYRLGLDLTLKARAAAGALAHGRGLIVSLRRQGWVAAAEEIRELLHSEGLATDPSPGWSDQLGELRPKLPAYIPEIDMEDVPLRDTNSRLASPSGDQR